MSRHGAWQFCTMLTHPPLSMPWRVQVHVPTFYFMRGGQIMWNNAWFLPARCAREVQLQPTIYTQASSRAGANLGSVAPTCRRVHPRSLCHG